MLDLALSGVSDEISEDRQTIAGGSAFDKAPAERRQRLLQSSAAIFDDFASGGGEHVDESRLGDIDVPVTIIEAGLSPAFLRRSCERLKGVIPQARTVTLANSGHHVGLDAADELISLLREAKPRPPPARSSPTRRSASSPRQQ